MSRDYTKIIAFQKADDLTLQVYEKVKSFPREELFGLTSQLRRASVSVPTNIVEGAGRESKKDYLRFLYISASSLNETEYLISLAYRLKYVNNEHYSQLKNKVKETYKPYTVS